MEELQGFIVSALNSNGGSMSYRDLHAATPPLQLRNLPQALLRLKSANQVVQRIIFDNETKSVSHTVEIVRGGD